KRILRVRVIEQLDDFGIRIDQIFVKDAVLGIGPALHINDEIAAIVRDLRIKQPLLLVRPLVNQFVLRLRRSKLMEEELVIVNGVSEFVFLVRLVVTAVKKSGAIFLPGGVRDRKSTR